MTTASLRTRLRKVERGKGIDGELERMTDAQLWRIVRSGYRQLATEHGDLAHAVRHLRDTDIAEDLALADLIEEDTGGQNAIRH